MLGDLSKPAEKIERQTSKPDDSIVVEMREHGVTFSQFGKMLQSFSNSVGTMTPVMETIALLQKLGFRVTDPRGKEIRP